LRKNISKDKKKEARRPLFSNHKSFPCKSFVRFNKGDGLPEHFSNSNVYMMVIRGILSLQLNEQDVHQYVKGDILNIPYNTKMNVRNNHEDILEIFVVKAPNPKNYVK